MARSQLPSAIPFGLGLWRSEQMQRILPYGDYYGKFLRKCNIDTAKIVSPRKRSTGQAFALSRPFHTKKYVVSYSAFLPTNIGFADKRNDVGRNEAASR